MDFNKYITGGDTLLISPYDNVDIVIKELVSFLRNKTYVTQLDLGRNKIGDEGIKELAKLTHLVSLHLNDSNIGDEGAKALASGSLAKLKFLHLYNNNIGDKGAEALASGNLVSLTSLDLNNNNIGDKGAEALANGNLVSLTSLNLNNNNIGNKGAKVLANGNLIGLTFLNLEKNNIGDEGAEALANGKLAKLTSLTLRNNNISDKGAREFVKLKDLGLNLSGNNISDQCVSELDNSIRGFLFVAKHSSLQIEPKTGIRHYIGSGVVVGLFLGLSIAYFAGAATLTPAIFAIAVFTAAVVVGALVGYGIGKFCEKISEEKQKDPDMSTWAAAKSVLCGVFTTQHRNVQKSV